ncbi:MAG: hypothetical protein BGO58_00365 [Sphingopyxis sp. 65-8]|nr:MAG: hypothetical protein BGO58_00365 [Sphingopyxis sp. 65-8]
MRAAQRIEVALIGRAHRSSDNDGRGASDASGRGGVRAAACEMGWTESSGGEFAVVHGTPFLAAAASAPKRVRHPID